MDEGAEVDVQESCKECGMKRAVVKSGFLYCVECGIRSADSQPLLDYTFDNFAGIKLHTTKVSGQKKKKENEFSNMWSTWHAHNMILLGLVDEVSTCSTVGETLSGVVLRLWSRWLRYNKIAFFAKTQNPTPQLTFGFKPRDLNLLYGIKKKREPWRTATTNDTEGEETARKKKKASLSVSAFIKQEQIQMSTQTSNVPLASQTLDELKLQVDDLPKKITFNSITKKSLKKIMTEEEYDLHIEEGYCGTRCKCFKHPRQVYKKRRNRTSIFNLYVLLYLGLRINDDAVQLGDILRWCKEGYITFGDYKHFFPEDMLIKSTDRIKLSPTMMTHKNILVTASHFSGMFNIKGIKAPDITKLIKRYIEELELPHELFGLVLKILSSLPKPSNYHPNEDKLMPNYEAIALCHIIVCLKMLFGLDGVSENKISDAATKCNDVLKLEKLRKLQVKFDEQEDYKQKFRRLFVFKDWMKYVEYRKICLSQCHYPTKMRIKPNTDDNPQLFLYHKSKTRRNQQDGFVKNACQSIIKSLLERIEDNYKQEIEHQFPLFSCSLTPMASNILDLLNWQYLNTEYSNFEVNIDLLDEDFSLYNLSFLIKPAQLKTILKKEGFILYTHVYSGNNDIIVDLAFKQSTSSTVGVKLKEIIAVVDCNADEWDGVLMADQLSNECKTDSNVLNDSMVSLSSVSRMSKHQTKKRKQSCIAIDLHTCFEKYWVRHYYIFKKNFTEESFEKELESNFPSSFVWLLKECANIAEISTLTLYHELMKIEKQIMEMNKVK